MKGLLTRFKLHDNMNKASVIHVTIYIKYTELKNIREFTNLKIENL